MHQDKFQLRLSTDGLLLSLLTFVRPQRIHEEFNIQGNRDSIVASYEQLESNIVAEHGEGPYESTDAQVIRLPFPCQQNFEPGIVWCEGDDELMEWCEDNTLPLQLMPVLRVCLKSIDKSRNRITFHSQILPSAPRAPPPGGGGGGRGGDGDGGRDDGDNGREGGRGGGGGGGVSVSDTPMWGRTHGAHVEGGLMAEAMRRVLREASRRVL